MRATLKSLAFAASLLGLTAGLATAEPVKITLLGVGDVYKFEGGKTRGGMARLNAVARAEKGRQPQHALPVRW